MISCKNIQQFDYIAIRLLLFKLETLISFVKKILVDQTYASPRCRVHEQEKHHNKIELSSPNVHTNNDINQDETDNNDQKELAWNFNNHNNSQYKDDTQHYTSV